jgi:ABC-type transport system substrate-binding protein
VKTELVSQEFVVFWGKEESMAASFFCIMSAGPSRAILARSVPVPERRSGWVQDPEVDKLIDEEQKTGDPKKRAALLQQVSRILMEDAAIGAVVPPQKSTVSRET